MRQRQLNYTIKRLRDADWFRAQITILGREYEVFAHSQAEAHEAITRIIAETEDRHARAERSDTLPAL